MCESVCEKMSVEVCVCVFEKKIFTWVKFLQNEKLKKKKTVFTGFAQATFSYV